MLQQLIILPIKFSRAGIDYSLESIKILIKKKKKKSKLGKIEIKN